MDCLKLGIAALSVAAFASVAAPSSIRQESVIAKDVTIASVPVGGLSREEASRQLRLWWEDVKKRKLRIHSRFISDIPDLKPSELGVALDDSASVQQAPLEGPAADAGDGTPKKLDPILIREGEPVARLVHILNEKGKTRAARVTFEKGAIVLHPEGSTLGLNENALPAAVAVALATNSPVELPVDLGGKHVKDEDLAKIKDVLVEFSTRFPARNRPRSSNIRLASSKIDGVVLEPGEVFSFNQTVGRRTIQEGFHEAGVYIRGRHGVGVGGGICQVSTTLYNAALLSDLKVLDRMNHSMPVPYVPLGRDATVDYGSRDLAIENTTGSPIALSATYVPGTLTFRVLGAKRAGLKVKILANGLKAWPRPVQQIPDQSLPIGKTRVISPGSGGFSISTFRLVYVNDKLVSREPLGRSYYTAEPRILAIGAKSPVQVAGAPADPPAPSVTQVPPAAGSNAVRRLGG